MKAEEAKDPKSRSLPAPRAGTDAPAPRAGSQVVRGREVFLEGKGALVWMSVETWRGAHEGLKIE